VKFGNASNKISYGKLREYFWGDELDSVMNYPLRAILIDFLLNKEEPAEAYAKIMGLWENYPQENYRAAVNILGSHDRMKS
jgi:4-alpha-glucanotransferase